MNKKIKKRNWIKVALITPIVLIIGYLGNLDNKQRNQHG